MPSPEPTTANGRTIAEMYRAFARGDVDYVMDQLHPDMDWIETESERVPIHGHSASPGDVLENVFAQVPEHFASFELQPQLWVESGDDVVVTGRLRARTHAGRDLDAPYAHVFSLRDGKVCRNENHHDTALWLAAFDN